MANNKKTPKTPKTKRAKTRAKATSAKAPVAQGDKVQTARTDAANLKHGKRWSAADIQESLPELHKLTLQHGDDDSGLVALRLRLLMLLKQGSVKSARAAMPKLGVTWSTISRWLKIYKEEGIEGLIAPGKGGREGLSNQHVALVERMAEEKASVDEIVEALEEEGVQISPWTVRKYLTPKSGGESWQAKTTAALDEAISEFAAEYSTGKRLGGWYKDESGNGIKFNTRMLEYLLELGATTLLKGKASPPEPRRPWGVPGAKGSHLGFWLTGELLEQVKAASNKLRANKNQTIKQLLEIGLIEAGCPPITEAQWAEQNSVDPKAQEEDDPDLE